ncbi:MAG: nucleotide pyrophosphohydrolase [Pseudomonadota bacterium]
MHDFSGDTLAKLRLALRDFAAARNWQPFHTPKNLAMALSVEAAELLEHFQWLTPEECTAITPAQRREIAHEMADVLNYLVRLADVMGIDLAQAAEEKIELNAKKYPPL